MADGTELPDVVALLYRADWTQLSLSASVHGLVDHSLRFTMIQAGAMSLLPWVKPPVTPPPPELGVDEFRTRLRVRPGGRFQVDGSAATGPRSGRRYEVRKLLLPRDLLSPWGLEVAERLTVVGRPALRVMATPRPGVWQAPWERIERIEVIVDAATGILLRRESFYEGQTLDMTELIDAVFGGTDEDFADLEDSEDSKVPPATEDDREEEDSSWEPHFVPDWQVRAAKGAANVLGTALTSGLRHSLRRPSDVAWKLVTEDDDPQTEMPPMEELADPEAPGAPIPDEVLHALHRSGTATFTATLHEWSDQAAWGERMRSSASSHGLSGLGSLAGELGEHAGTTHQRTRVAIGSAGRYRLEFLGPGSKNSPTAITCDGSRLWRQYPDRVTVSPAIALVRERNAPDEVAELIDTSGLLRDDVSVVAETEFNRRRVVVLRVHPRPERTPADLPIDAELGILLRQVSYADGKLVGRDEFRDVTPLPPGHEDDIFQFTVPADVRVVETGEGPFGEIDIPEPVRLAMRAADSAAKTARGLLGSLSERLRRLLANLHAVPREALQYRGVVRSIPPGRRTAICGTIVRTTLSFPRYRRPGNAPDHSPLPPAPGRARPRLLRQYSRGLLVPSSPAHPLPSRASGHAELPGVRPALSRRRMTACPKGSAPKADFLPGRVSGEHVNPSRPARPAGGHRTRCHGACRWLLLRVGGL